MTELKHTVQGAFEQEWQAIIDLLFSVPFNSYQFMFIFFKYALSFS